MDLKKLIKFKKTKKDEEQKGTSSTKIHVVVCKLMNDRTPVEIAEFNAIQDKDENFNMRIIFEDIKFKEELERKRHYLLEMLQYKLELSDLTKEDKLERIDVKIKEIEEKITQIKDGKIGNVKVNKKDLEMDLRHFKVLRFVVENTGDGSFEIINSSGDREMRFLSHDGIFDPYFYRSNSDKGQPLTMYPDIGLSRKYYKEIDERVEDRFLKQQNSFNFFTGLKGIIITVGILFLIIALVIGNVRNYEARKEIDIALDQCRARNTEVLNQCGNQYINLLKSGVANITIIKEESTDQLTTSELQTIG